MSWNDGFKRRKFKEKIKKQTEYFRSLGMSEEQISAINEFDREEFLSDRRYRMHTQPLDVSVFYEDDLDESDNALLMKFRETLSVTIEDCGDAPRHWWVEQLETAGLASAVKALAEDDIELLTMIVQDGMTHREIALITGVSRQAVTDRLARIRKIIKK
ncbi:MAG: hypothetical protein K5647_05215 [Clostridiales bacterium]|nr:hypothetical protein [Clostridiales bacterium]